MSTSVLKNHNNKVPFTTTNISSPLTFVEIPQSENGFAIGISGGASALEVDAKGVVHIPGGLSAGQVPLVTEPAHYNSTGVAGSLAVGTDSGSPPLNAFYVCIATNTWIRIDSTGTFSNNF